MENEKKYIDQELDLSNYDQIDSVIDMLVGKKKIIFDRKYFTGSAIVRRDWRTKMLIKCLKYIKQSWE